MAAAALSLSFPLHRLQRAICDQITISIALPSGMLRSSVRILAFAELNGGTHMSVEDVGVLRSIPGMVIYDPADGEELAKAIPVDCCL